MMKQATWLTFGPFVAFEVWTTKSGGAITARSNLPPLGRAQPKAFRCLHMVIRNR